MEKVKAALRLLIIVILLLLATSGIGITGNFLNPTRERYMDNEIKIEKTEKRENEENEEESKN